MSQTMFANPYYDDAFFNWGKMGNYGNDDSYAAYERIYSPVALTPENSHEGFGLGKANNDRNAEVLPVIVMTKPGSTTSKSQERIPNFKVAKVIRNAVGPSTGNSTVTIEYHDISPRQNSGGSPLSSVSSKASSFFQDKRDLRMSNISNSVPTDKYDSIPFTYATNEPPTMTKNALRKQRKIENQHASGITPVGSFNPPMKRKPTVSKASVDEQTLLDEKHPDWTVGSRFHAKGQCKPCGLFHKNSCINGAMCFYCHLCEDGDAYNKPLRKKLTKAKAASQQRVGHCFV